MKKLIYTSLITLTFCFINFGQKPQVVARPVEDSKPFIVSSEQLENLGVAASMDRFGKTDDNTKKAKLDLFTGLISSENKTVEYVFRLQAENKQQVSKNMEFIYKYLVGKKKINPTRISFAVAPETEEQTEFWLIPNKNISIPTCRDCSIIQAEDEENLKNYFQIKKSKK